MSLDPMNSGPQKGGMHPEDKRNMLLFVVLSLAVWFAFDHFVIKPKEAQILANQQAASSHPATTAKAPAPVIEEKLLDRTTVLQADQRISIKNPELSGSFSLKGNRIDDLSLNNYFDKIDRKDRVVLMSPSGTKSAHYTELGWLADDEKILVPNAETVWMIEGSNQTLAPNAPVTLKWNNGAGLIFERVLEIDDNYLFTVTQKVTNTSETTITLYPYGALARRGVPEGYGQGVGYEGPQGYIADEMHEIDYSDFEDRPEITFQGSRGWIGFGEKYWFSGILPTQSGNHTFRFGALLDPKDETKTLYQVDVRGDGIEIAQGKTIENKTNIFVGVKKVDLLDMYEQKTGAKHFDLAVDFGVLYFLTRPLYFLLTLFNSWVHNFGIAILMLTLVVRFLVFPLASASYRSFAKLRKVGPQMAELKIRYGNDKPRMQQELIKLYETERVNPMAGCFPLLLQIPVFFAIYKVISIAVEMRHAPFFGWIHDLSAMDSLSVFNAFGLLPYDVPKFLHIGPWSLVMLAMMLIQKQLNPPPQDQIQRDIANYMPWIVTYTLSSFPVGLVIYWAFSNIFSVLQQMAIMRSMGVPVYLFSPDAALEHHSSHEQAVEDAKERAKRDRESETKNEPVVEALFDNAPQKDDSKK